MKHIGMVCDKLKKAKFYASRKKSEFFASSMNVLGHIIDDEGLKASPEKIARIEAWTTPRNKKQLQEFLGVVNYISQFIPHLVSITAPLTSLTGTEEFVWTATHDQAMENVKRAAANNLVMKPIDHETALPIWLITDASDTGVGAWVGQGETADTARPAALHSRKFSNAQMNYGTTDKETLVIIDALAVFHHLLAGNEFTIVTDHQPLMYLKTSRTPTKKQLRWRGFIGQFRTKAVYRPGQWNYLADVLSQLYTEDKTYPHTAKDPTQEDSENDTTPLTQYIEPDFADMSRFEPLEVDYTQHCSDCNSDCSVHQAMLDPTNYRNKNPINTWGDYQSISSSRSNEVIKHSAQHWSDCFVLMCPDHEDDKIMNKVYVGEAPSSPPVNDPQQGAMEAAMDTDLDEERVLSPRPRPDLSAIKRRLHEALGCSTDTYLCESPECPAHQAGRASPTKPLYGGPLSTHNVIPVIEPPRLPHHDRSLYEVYNDIAEEEESDVTRWERIVDKRDIVQARNEMETIWREHR